MTEQQIDSLTVKMLQHPEQLTDEEVKQITNDERMRQIYATAVMVKAASQPRRSYDTDKEWANFSKRLTAKAPNKSRHIVRAAAVFVGVLLATALTLVLFKTINNIDNTTSAPLATTSTDTVMRPTPASEPELLANAEKSTSEKISDESPLAEMTNAENNFASKSTPQKLPTKKANNPKKAAAELQNTEEADPLAQSAASQPSQADVQQKIAIQRARVDNEIAQTMADRYKAEYLAIQRARQQSSDIPEIRVNCNCEQPQTNNFMRLVMQ